MSSMKKLRYILFTALLFLGVTTLFSACQKDGDDFSESNLIGTWKSVKSDYQVYIDGKLFDSGTETDQGETTITFVKGGTIYVTGYDLEADGEEGHRYTDTGTWLLSGKQLSILYTNDETGETDDVVVVTIEKLTAKELVVSSSEEETMDGSSFRRDAKDYLTKL